MQTNTEAEQTAALLRSVALWFDGMSKFIAVSKGEWRNAYTGQVLMAQQLGRHSLELKRELRAVADRLASDG